MIVQKRHCTNMNHRRSDAPVRFCPDCGESVNKSAPLVTCSKDDHAKRRKSGALYCVNCGERLRT